MRRFRLTSRPPAATPHDQRPAIWSAQASSPRSKRWQSPDDVRLSLNGLPELRKPNLEARSDNRTACEADKASSAQSGGAVAASAPRKSATPEIDWVR